MSSTEQTENARSLCKTISDSVNTAVENNKAHATVTTNAWKDAMFTIEQASKSLGVLLFQLQNFSQADASNISDRAGVLNSLNSSNETLTNMSLVFHTDTRWKLLKKSRDAVAECIKTAQKIKNEGSSRNSGAVYQTGQRDSTIGSSSTGPKLEQKPINPNYKSTGNANMDLLNQPMPTVQKATVVFNPNSGGSDFKTNSDGTFERPKLGTNIKPTNMLNFSSAESSASARLGISGKCSLCGAVRDASSKFCTACGKTSNVIF